MKKKKADEIPLWENNMPEICRYCARARRISEKEEVYCEKKKQIFREDNTCKKYIFDILKTETRRKKPFSSKHSQEQFEI